MILYFKYNFILIISKFLEGKNMIWICNGRYESMYIIKVKIYKGKIYKNKFRKDIFK